MTNNRKHWKLIVRFVAGECSEREEAEVRALISVDEEKGRIYDEVRRLWDASASTAGRKDPDGAWRKLDQRIQQNTEIISLADARAAYRLDRGKRTLRRSLRLAAVFAIVVIGAVVAVQFTADPFTEVRDADYAVFATQRGERATIPLPDGSIVFLNADSKLIVPSTFGAEARDLQLEGQGYFQVESSVGHTFTVQTELATVRVTGTEFDVDAYPGADKMQVVVASGEVHVRSNHDRGIETIVLKPRDIGLVLGTGEQVVRRDVDVRRYFAWKDGRLLFNNSDFEDVARSLERWYDLEIELSQTNHRLDGLTASFRDEPVDEVLGVVSMALNLNYRREGKKVIFYPASRTTTTIHTP